MLRISQNIFTFGFLIVGFLIACDRGSSLRTDMHTYSSGLRPRRQPERIILYDAVDDQAKCQFGSGWSNLYGGCYFITKIGVTWETASKACHTIDPLAEFGTLWSAADMKFLAQLARSREIPNVYVNGRYDAQSSDFRWHYRRPVNAEFTPWGVGEPKTSSAGQAIVLQVPSQPDQSGHLAVVPAVTQLPALCKRAAKGFRRKSQEEIQHSGNLMSHGPSGWSLSRDKTLTNEQPNTRLATGTNRLHRVATAGTQSGSSSTASNESPSNSEHTVRRHESPAAASILGLVDSTTVAPRTLPPPLSRNRKFIPKLGQFESVLPVGKVKESKNLEVSAIEPVDVVDIVKVREDKLNGLFGRSALRLKESMTHYPEDYRYPSTDYQRMAHVLTTELLAQDQRERNTEAPFEKAKVLAMRLFAEGRAIQCFFGDKEDAIANRQVECIATAGVIEACVKQVLLSGKIIRGCGLPGTDRQMKKSGCVQTTNGEICYCNHDNCNSASRSSNRTFGMLFFLLSFLFVNSGMHLRFYRVL